MQDILVLGAGVSGISTGILLLKSGYNVTIWAKDTSKNITSYKAAALWYPYLCNPPEKATKWAKFTYEKLKNEIVDDPNSGCKREKVIEIFDRKVSDAWWKDAVPDFQRVPQDKLPEGYVDGYEIDSFLIDTTFYMDYLIKMFESLGGKIIQKEIKNISEAFENFNIVVNCTGLASRELFNDKEVFPIRGQMVKIKNNGFDYAIADDDGPNKLAVVIPRINDIMLGGTTDANNTSLEPDPKDTEDILRKAAKLNPTFKNAEVIEATVGLRPFRNEVRLEAEKINGKHVVHNYGHGGAGFTLSWGCANDVVELVKNLS